MTSNFTMALAPNYYFYLDFIPELLDLNQQYYSTYNTLKIIILFCIYKDLFYGLSDIATWLTFISYVL